MLRITNGKRKPKGAVKYPAYIQQYQVPAGQRYARLMWRAGQSTEQTALGTLDQESPTPLLDLVLSRAECEPNVFTLRRLLNADKRCRD